MLGTEAGNDLEPPAMKSVEMILSVNVGIRISWDSRHCVLVLPQSARRNVTRRRLGRASQYSRYFCLVVAQRPPSARSRISAQRPHSACEVSGAARSRIESGRTTGFSNHGTRGPSGRLSPSVQRRGIDPFPPQHGADAAGPRRAIYVFQNPLLIFRAELAPLCLLRHFRIRRTGYKRNCHSGFAHDDSPGRPAL